MLIQPGQKLSHYELVAKIGEGGMGVVWKAVDTNLDRDVAIKILPEAFAADAERLVRFEREAKLLAALNHPNIASVYGLHEVNGQHFIAMEFVPGEDLAERLARGPLAIEDAIDVAQQVAQALEAAHEQGVIHRDLKPANIRRTPDGKIKVLDLGLAKALIQETSGDTPSLSLSPTVTSAGTIVGTLLGTASYMSPEQAKGRPVDRRADIWAFGVVLYEMLTGKKLFEAETLSETLAAVLRDEISLETLPDKTPASVLVLLRRCLDRDVRTRLRDIGEARIGLSSDASIIGEPGVASTSTAPTRPRLLPWLLVGLLSVVAAVALWRAPTESTGDGGLLTLVAPIPTVLELPPYQLGALALSPDGKNLALVLTDTTERMLYVRRLDRADFVEMAGTEGATTPFFSPDSEWIGFFADNKLKKIPVGGGAPVTLCDSSGSTRGADWGSDGFIVFSRHFSEPLMRVSGAGGEPTEFTTVDKSNGERTHRWPHAVAGEDLILYTVGTISSPENYDVARIQAIRPSTGETRTVIERASIAWYVSTGHLIFGREGFLFAVPFDLDSLEVRGKPVPVLEGVRGMRNSGVVHADFARNGLIAYIAGKPRSELSRLVRRSRDGTSELLTATARGYVTPVLSPDRKSVAMPIGGAATYDIWSYQIEQETLTRLTFEGDNDFAVWSHDSRRIAFASIRNDALMSVYVKAADGSGDDEMLVSPDQIASDGEVGGVSPFGWTADDRHLLIEFTNENSDNLAVFSEETGEVEILLETPASEQQPTLSPNGRWLAYSTDESGDYQIFVRAYPGPGGKWQVSTGGGSNPRWSPDGSELYYRYLKDLFAVGIDDGSGSFKASRPSVVFDDLDSVGGDYDYDVFDTDQFLLLEPVRDDAALVGVTVIVNWLDELERRVPSDP